MGNSTVDLSILFTFTFKLFPVWAIMNGTSVNILTHFLMYLCCISVHLMHNYLGIH